MREWLLVLRLLEECVEDQGHAASGGSSSLLPVDPLLTDPAAPMLYPIMKGTDPTISEEGNLDGDGDGDGDGIGDGVSTK